MVYGYCKEVEMKIIFFVPDFNTGGGITSSLRNLSNLLVKKGHVVDVFNLAKKPLPSDFDKRINLVANTSKRIEAFRKALYTYRKFIGNNAIKI